MNLFSNMEFFAKLARGSSIASVAHEMDLTPSAASKKLRMLEEYYGTKLVRRTPKSLVLTAEGETLLEGVLEVLDGTRELKGKLESDMESLAGLITITAPFGLGRHFIADVIAEFRALHPATRFKLNLTDKPLRVTDDPFDIGIHVGRPPDARIVAKRLSRRNQIICASPNYLSAYGAPNEPSDLKKHKIIGLRQYDEVANYWQFMSHDESIGVRVPLSLETNDGEIAVNWACTGLGIVRRAEWHVKPLIDDGLLVPVLTEYTTQSTDIYALYSKDARKVKRLSWFLDFLEEKLNLQA